MNMNIKTKALI